MIEELIRNYLNDHLDVPVFLEVIGQAPDRYVTLQQSGSQENNYIYSVVITVQSYAESQYQASLLNKTVKKKMKEMAQENFCSAVRLNSDYYQPDTRTKNYRYQSVWVVTTYE